MNGKLIDTNILVYAYDSSEKEKFSCARKIISSIWSNGSGYTTVQNLTEFFVVVTRKIEYPISISDTQTIIHDILHSDKWQVFDRDMYTIERAITLVEKCGVHFWDALIAQVMLDNDISAILTENTDDFSKIPSINVENPFL